MNTKEFVSKYNLNLGNKFNQSHFLSDFTNELAALMELQNSSSNIKAFKNTINCMKMKFDAISNKTKFGLPDKMWNYWYATTVVPMMDSMFPKEKQMREQKKKEWEERRKEFDDWHQQFTFDWHKHLLGLMIRSNKPIEAMEYFGLKDGFTEEDIKSAYKQLTLKNHPDRGGDPKEFIKITEYKNQLIKCIA